VLLKENDLRGGFIVSSKVQTKKRRVKETGEKKTGPKIGEITAGRGKKRCADAKAGRGGCLARRDAEKGGGGKRGGAGRQKNRTGSSWRGKRVNKRHAG